MKPFSIIDALKRAIKTGNTSKVNAILHPVPLPRLRKEMHPDPEACLHYADDKLIGETEFELLQQQHIQRGGRVVMDTPDSDDE